MDLSQKKQELLIAFSDVYFEENGNPRTLLPCRAPEEVTNEVWSILIETAKKIDAAPTWKEIETISYNVKDKLLVLYETSWRRTSPHTNWSSTSEATDYYRIGTLLERKIAERIKSL